MTLRALASVLLLSAACTAPSKASAPRPVEGKPRAPVAVEAALSADAAKLTVRFLAAGTQVSVTAAGLDGLALRTPEALLTEATVAEGEVRALEVAFTPGPGRSTLAVNVSGRFRGQPQARVVTFAVGDGPLPSDGAELRTDDGDAVKLMP